MHRPHWSHPHSSCISFCSKSKGQESGGTPRDLRFSQFWGLKWRPKELKGPKGYLVNVQERICVIPLVVHYCAIQSSTIPKMAPQQEVSQSPHLQPNPQQGELAFGMNETGMIGSGLWTIHQGTAAQAGSTSFCWEIFNKKKYIELTSNTYVSNSISVLQLKKKQEQKTKNFWLGTILGH